MKSLLATILVSLCIAMPTYSHGQELDKPRIGKPIPHTQAAQDLGDMLIDMFRLDQIEEIVEKQVYTPVQTRASMCSKFFFDETRKSCLKFWTEETEGERMLGEFVRLMELEDALKQEGRLDFPMPIGMLAEAEIPLTTQVLIVIVSKFVVGKHVPQFGGCGVSKGCLVSFQFKPDTAKLDNVLIIRDDEEATGDLVAKEAEGNK